MQQLNPFIQRAEDELPSQQSQSCFPGCMARAAHLNFPTLFQAGRANYRELVICALASPSERGDLSQKGSRVLILGKLLFLGLFFCLNFSNAFAFS